MLPQRQKSSRRLDFEQNNIVSVECSMFIACSGKDMFAHIFQSISAHYFCDQIVNDTVLAVMRYAYA